jgi:hypothetical protein
MQINKPLASAVFVPVLVGSTGLIHLANQPRFALIQTVDVVQLLGSGMCFGVALFAVIAMLRGKRGA